MASWYFVLNGKVRKKSICSILYFTIFIKVILHFQTSIILKMVFHDIRFVKSYFFYNIVTTSYNIRCLIFSHVSLLQDVLLSVLLVTQMALLIVIVSSYSYVELDDDLFDQNKGNMKIMLDYYLTVQSFNEMFPN